MADYYPVAKTDIELTPDRLSTAASFEAVLSRQDTSYGAAFYKLTINLRIRLLQSFLMPPLVKDANGSVFWIRPWTAPEWQSFVMGAKIQAALWNNRFWLKAPPSVTDYDYTASGIRMRPYIDCELAVDFNAAIADAHRTINVYNLDLSRIAPAATKNAFTFRSSSFIYDSLDAFPAVTAYDAAGKPISSFPVIAHEIGHAIGQPHIGVMHKTPMCQFAMDSGGLGAQDWSVCYVDRFGSNANIMGGGSAFSADNAISWKWAIMFLRKNKPEYWEVLTSKPASGAEVVHDGSR